MGQLMPNRSVSEVFAHALAAETEAVSRCTEFADFLEARGDDETARLFRELAMEDTRHALLLKQRLSQDDPAPAPSGVHSWLDDRPATPDSHAFVYHLMTPYDALTIALRAERRTREFFERVSQTSDDAEIREMALEMMREEDSHIHTLSRALERAPRPLRSESDFEQLLFRTQ